MISEIEGKYCSNSYKYTRIDYHNLNNTILNDMLNDLTCPIKKNKKNVHYLLVGSGFDIETTAYNEHAYMYVWSMSFNNNIFAKNKITVVRGRTWNEFKTFIDRINTILNGKKLICFVANLGYEFQFVRKHINITDGFFREMRHPFYIECENVIFMEALNFNGRSLKELAKNTCNTQKAVGDLDYTIIRNNECDFTEEENYYIDNDVIILAEFSKWYFKKFMVNNFHFTPVSIQQFIRRCIKKEKEKEKENCINIEDAQPDEELYHILMDKCFIGGHNHGNMKYIDEFIGKEKKMGSFDLTSIYPSNMLKRYMPYKFIECRPSLFYEYREKCCCLILLTMYNVKNTTNHSVISQSKCDICISPRVDNGRILTADTIKLWCTELDYDIFKKFYTFEEKIEKLYCSKRIKLPKYCIKSMCDSYKLKHDLKKKKLAYAFEKSIVNSNYGVYVTKRNEIEIKYDNEKDKFSVEKNNTSYYKDKKYKTTLPQWGVWITAHCRHILLSMLYEIETSNTRSEVVYDDTDSLKVTYIDEVKYLFDDFNRKETELNREMCEYYNLDFEIFNDIGLFDFEGYINTFKVLRSKCYIYTDEKGFHQTIAGLKKDTLQHYAKNLRMKRKKINLMKELTFGFLLNNVDSEKLTTIYDDEYYEDTINGVKMSELSGVCLTEIPFEIKKSKITDIWLEMIFELKKKELLLEKR